MTGTTRRTRPQVADEDGSEVPWQGENRDGPPTLRRAVDASPTPLPAPGVNAVTLRGRVSAAPEPRELPSGTTIVTLRVTVARAPSPMTRGSKQASDWVDCVAWGSRQRRRVVGWRLGDLVEVEGALRRRFYRGGSGTAMRLEVEVLGARMVARAERRPPVS